LAKIAYIAVDILYMAILYSRVEKIAGAFFSKK